MESKKRTKRAQLARRAKKKVKLSAAAVTECDLTDDLPVVKKVDTETASTGESEAESELEIVQDGASEEDTADVSQPEVKSSKIKGLYAPPTHSELQSLKETQDLFSSNLMRLQITELLSEVKPKSASRKTAEAFLHKLKEAITALPSSDKIDLCDGHSLLGKKVQYPLNLELSNAKGKFQFIAPSVIKVVGGLLLGTLCKPHPSVDLSLHIPVETLQVKDILNYRYFQKRALYLSIIARHLLKKRKSFGIKSLQFTADNPLLPTLVLTLEGSKVTVHLHTSISDSEYFKRSKLSPDHNNVRRYQLSQLPTWSDEFENRTDESQNPSDDPPTPHYNASLLLEQGGRERHLVTLYSCLRDSPGLVDAVILCKVWARQRGLDKGYGCLSGFHFSMLVAWLVSQRKLNAHMSSYQAFRVIMQTFVTSDCTISGISMSQQPLEAYRDAYEVVFVDDAGLNIFAELSKERYKWIQHEAALALRNLDDQSTKGFHALFMTPLPPYLAFDTLCKFPALLLSPRVVIKNEEEIEAISLDAAVWPLPLLMNRVLPILHRGLGKRVKLLTLLPWSSKQWSVSEAPSTVCDDITIALLLDTDRAFSTIEMGPPSDSSEATAFREFWGDKAQLRRFKDGSIKEAVLWAESRGVASQMSVCERIIQYLLERHVGLNGDCVVSRTDCLDPLISLPSYSRHGNASIGDDLVGGVMGVVTELGRDLRQMKDLPLSVSSVQGSGPAFRHTEVLPGHPWNGKLSSKYTSPPGDDSQSDCYYPSRDHATPPFVPVHKVVCQLESSGKWPDDVEAIEKIKTSFYTYISKALREQRGLISSPTADYLDILKDGYVFRVRIHYHREVLLLKDAITKTTGTEESVLKEKLALIERELVTSPLITSWLNGVRQQFPAFSAGARLCKRWVSAHLLVNHLSDEAVELMVAYLFLHPAPYTPPATPYVAFLRFLSLICSFDWSSEQLIVNFNNKLSGSAVSEKRTKFSAARSSLPCMVIATPTDHAYWTTPSLPVFARLQLLAKQSLELLTSKSIEDMRQVFRPPLDDYHVIIHLHKRHVPRREQAVDTTEMSDPTHRYNHKPTHLPVVDFDPVHMYVQLLERTYSEFALFFHDQYGGSIVAVAWKPSAFIAQPFKVMQIKCHVISSEGMVPDTDAMVTDFELLGEGLVKSIEVISHTMT